MLNFLSTPFLVIAMASLFIAGFLNGNGYAIVEMKDEDDYHDDD